MSKDKLEMERARGGEALALKDNKVFRLVVDGLRDKNIRALVAADINDDLAIKAAKNMLAALAEIDKAVEALITSGSLASKQLEQNGK
jgi:hypothetical protein